jgi:hypothetical protein
MISISPHKNCMILDSVVFRIFGGCPVFLDETCFENDDWTLDPDLKLTGKGVKICEVYYDGDEGELKRYWIKETMTHRKAAKQQIKNEDLKFDTPPPEELSQTILAEINALKTQLNHIEETITDPEMREELKDDLKVNFKKRIARLYGNDQE